MAEESDHNSTMEAFETMLKDEQSRRFFELSPIEVAGIFLWKKRNTSNHFFNRKC